MDHPLAQTVISLLEQGGAHTFVVKTAEGSLQDGMQTWPVPSLAFVRGTTLGRAPEPSSGQQRFSVEDGRLVPIPRERWVSVPYQDQVDALLFLGPTAERKVKTPPVSICSAPGMSAPISA